MQDNWTPNGSNVGLRTIMYNVGIVDVLNANTVLDVLYRKVSQGLPAIVRIVDSAVDSVVAGMNGYNSPSVVIGLDEAAIVSKEEFDNL